VFPPLTEEPEMDDWVRGRRLYKVQTLRLRAGGGRTVQYSNSHEYIHDEEIPDSREIKCSVVHWMSRPRNAPERQRRVPGIHLFPFIPLFGLSSSDSRLAF
jgi:hypothetical protein